MFLKMGGLENVVIFTGKPTGLQACNFVKKRLQHRCFSVFYRTLPVAAFLDTVVVMGGSLQ